MKPEINCIYFRPVSKTHRGKWRCEELDNPGTCECKTPIPTEGESGSLHPVIESQASIVDIWAARERNGHILLWNKKPYGTDEGNYYHKDGYIRMLDYDIMKEIEKKLKTLKNGDSPLKISLVIGKN